MTTTSEILEQVLGDTAPSEEVLLAVRSRRDEVLRIAGRYRGALRTYSAGSIAHHTANSDTDADCGVVLDRRSYPELGPDGAEEGPNRITEDVREYIRTSIKENHPDATFRVSKRAVRIRFNEPLVDGTDPTVDLIVALTRAEGALWIPNNERERWDPSDPERHTLLLTADDPSLRRKRAKVIRLAKTWNKGYSVPGLSSFNISALALAAVQKGTGLPDALANFFEYASRDLSRRLTPDPAGVSGPIRVLAGQEAVVGRLRQASEAINDALGATGDPMRIREYMSSVFRNNVSPPPGSRSKGALVAALSKGNSGVGLSGGSLVTVSPTVSPLKTTRSYGYGTPS